MASIRQRNTAALTWVSKRKNWLQSSSLERLTRKKASFVYTNNRYPRTRMSGHFESSMSKIFMTPTPGLWVSFSWPTRVHPPRTQSTMIAQMIRSRPPTFARILCREGCWSQNGWLPSFTKGLVQLHTNLYTKLKTKLTMTVACRYGRSMFKLPLIAASIIHKKNTQPLHRWYA